jgi:hypothetical protein
MNGIIRFLTLGMQDADRRVAAALEPRSYQAADRYLESSRLVTAIDRGTRALGDWWSDAEFGRTSRSAIDAFFREPRLVRYQAVGAALITAVTVHVVITLVNDPRPGWFWMVIPAAVATFAVLLLAGSRSSHSTD